MTQCEKKDRASNIELLRIILMYLIVVYHFCDNFMHENFCANQVFCYVIGNWGSMCVAGFFIITAWFLIDSFKFDVRKIIRIVLQSLFYGGGIAVICILLGNPMQASVKEYIQGFLGIAYGTYWYATVYCMLLCVAPFLLKLVHECTTAQLKALTVVLTVLFPLFRMISTQAQICNFSWAVYIFVLVAYLKRVPDNLFERYAVPGFILMVAIDTFLCSIASLSGIAIIIDRVYMRYSLFQLLPALFLFYIFKNLRCKNSRFINEVSKGTFGVYLFHVNHIWGEWLQIELFKSSAMFQNGWFSIYVLFAALTIFVVAECIDLVRRKWFAPMTEKVMSRMIILNRINNFLKC